MAKKENLMTMNLRAIRCSPLAVLTITDRARAINALKMIQAMTSTHHSSDEARTLSEIADYWSNKDSDSDTTLESR
ncbi:MAG: hypothetical protein HC889_08855 [Synechococcaceae cyanobacterium SM1_2_3]|nr:hypothetical protein [Synechococcaceae cyanobacterium SM1_2_3]